MTVTITSADLRPGAAEFYRLLGPLVHGDEGRGWPAAWLADGVCWSNEAVAAVAADRRVLLDPARCPAELLVWLAQFNGIDGRQMTEAQLRAAIPAPEGWRRGSVPVVRIAALRAMVPGAALTILVNSDPATYPTRAAGHWTFIAPTADVPDQAAYEAAVRAAIYAPFKPHFLYGNGDTWDGASGSWDAQTTTWAEG